METHGSGRRLTRRVRGTSRGYSLLAAIGGEAGGRGEGTSVVGRGWARGNDPAHLIFTATIGHGGPFEAPSAGRGRRDRGGRRGRTASFHWLSFTT
jgi:hypothetical protein